jgi:hypothetical protein
MAVANVLAYYHTKTIADVKSFILQALGNIIVITYLVIYTNGFESLLP